MPLSGLGRGRLTWNALYWTRLRDVGRRLLLEAPPKQPVLTTAPELGGEPRQSLILSLGRPILDGDVLTLDVAQLAQPLSECFVEERTRHEKQKPDPSGLPGRLLGRGGERGGHEAERQSDCECRANARCADEGIVAPSRTSLQ